MCAHSAGIKRFLLVIVHHYPFLLLWARTHTHARTRDMRSLQSGLLFPLHTAVASLDRLKLGERDFWLSLNLAESNKKRRDVCRFAKTPQPLLARWCSSFAEIVGHGQSVTKSARRVCVCARTCVKAPIGSCERHKDEICALRSLSFGTSWM